MPEVGQSLATTVAVHTEQLRRMDESHDRFGRKLDSAIDLMQEISSTLGKTNDRLEAGTKAMASVVTDLNHIENRVSANEESLSKISGAVNFAKWAGGTGILATLTGGLVHLFGGKTP